MSRRQYPRWAGSRAYVGGANRSCDCCEDSATWSITVQISIFRGEDGDYLVCDAHRMQARSDFDAFTVEWRRRQAYMQTEILARKETTGREWRGLRRNLPPGYVEVTP
jgi:hypothetical protein